jgi:hypothetical protein
MSKEKQGLFVLGSLLFSAFEAKYQVTRGSHVGEEDQGSLLLPLALFSQPNTFPLWTDLSTSAPDLRR